MSLQEMIRRLRMVDAFQGQIASAVGLPGATPVSLPGVTPVGPPGGSFVNSIASGNQSTVSSVTDAILLPQAGNDKPVTDVSINAVEQLDAWTAYKTERGPVFYYNAVTGISTSEKPVGNEGELSMTVQECYLCLISRLPESATTEQVRQIFSQFGRILDAMVLLTPTHLAIVMEYAAGGELFERICRKGRCVEDELLLITNGFKLLKVGGYLFYNTCSLTVAQNEDAVEQFLLQNSSTGSLEVELEAKVNKKVQDNIMLLKKLAEVNPGLNLDIADYCATVPSEDEQMQSCSLSGLPLSCFSVYQGFKTLVIFCRNFYFVFYILFLGTLWKLWWMILWWSVVVVG